jgi:hypothetical protein
MIAFWHLDVAGSARCDQPKGGPSIFVVFSFNIDTLFGVTIQPAQANGNRS